MNITVEQTPRQKLSSYILEHVNSVSIVHIPGTQLSDSIHTITSIKKQGKKVNLIPHIAARTLKNKNELYENCKKFLDLGIKDILIVGGSADTGICYSNAFEVYNDIQCKNYQFNLLCGVYPVHENKTEVDNIKYTKFTRGVTQVCLNHHLLNQFDKKTIIGVPSKCSIKSLLKFIKICGVGQSIYEVKKNISGFKYISFSGFDTNRFVKNLKNNNDIHIFNFGNMENTIKSLQKLL